MAGEWRTGSEVVLGMVESGWLCARDGSGLVGCVRGGGYIVVAGVLRRNSRPHQYP